MEIQPGTVVEGTMRTEDLLRAWKAELAMIELDGARTISTYYKAVFDWLRQFDNFDYAPPQIRNEAEHCREELYARLDELAPEGMYFGTLDGDGSDFGFWEVVDDA